MPDWFRDNRDFGNLETGLRTVGFDPEEVAGIMGENWLQFFDLSFGTVRKTQAHWAAE